MNGIPDCMSGGTRYVNEVSVSSALLQHLIFVVLSALLWAARKLQRYLGKL